MVSTTLLYHVQGWQEYLASCCIGTPPALRSAIFYAFLGAHALQKLLSVASYPRFSTSQRSAQGTCLRQARRCTGVLLCALLLLPSIVPTAVVDAKRRAAHTKHHGGAAAAALSSGDEGEAWDPQQSGGVLEGEDDGSTAVPLEAAEQHFHLMPTRSAETAIVYLPFW